MIIPLRTVPAPFVQGELSLDQIEMVRLFSKQKGIELPCGMSGEIWNVSGRDILNLRWHSPLDDKVFFAAVPVSVQMVKRAMQKLCEPMPEAKEVKKLCMQLKEMPESDGNAWVEEQISVRKWCKEMQLYVENLEKTFFSDPWIISGLCDLDCIMVQMLEEDDSRNALGIIEEYWRIIGGSEEGHQIHTSVSNRWMKVVSKYIEKIHSRKNEVNNLEEADAFVRRIEDLYENACEAFMVHPSIVSQENGQILRAYARLLMKYIGINVIDKVLQLKAIQMMSCAEENGNHVLALDLDMLAGGSSKMEVCYEYFFAPMKFEDHGSCILQQVRLAEERRSLFIDIANNPEFI